MKKSFFAVMLSAAFIATTALFGMDAQENSDNKVSSHKHCSSCSPFDVDVNTVENGAFKQIPHEVIVQIIEKGDLATVIVMSATSKMMYNLSQTVSIWESIAKEHNEAINPFLCAKEQFKTSFLLFRDPSKKYNLPLKRLLACVDHTSKQHIAEGNDTYSLMLGKRKFTLNYTGYGVELPEEVKGDLSLTFEYNSSTKRFVNDYLYCVSEAFLTRLSKTDDAPTLTLIRQYDVKAGDYVETSFEIISTAE